jgi:beta-phosphoglucomutase-like phosphatase (HAD superfamily)
MASLRVIEQARRHGVRLAIASTTTPISVTTLRANAFGEEAVGWFEVIAAGDDVRLKKPASDIYFLTLEKMGLSAHECLAFENSQSGLRSARAAGIRTAVTVTEYTRWQDPGSAEPVVDHLGESKLPFQLLPSNAEYNRARESVGDATMFDVALGERLLAA